MCVSFSVASSVVDSGSSYEFLEIRIRPILFKHIQLFFYLVGTYPILYNFDCCDTGRGVRRILLALLSRAEAGIQIL